MSGFANDASKKNIVSALEKNESDLFACLGQKGKKNLSLEADISWIIARPSWPNFLYDPRFDGVTAERRIKEISAQIERGDLPPVLKVGPQARPDNLGQLLVDGGFKRLEISRPGMAIDLQLTVDKVPGDLGGLSISPIADRSSLREWVAVISDKNLFFEESYLAAVMLGSGLTMYVGRLGDKAISIAMLFISEGIAGIYLVNVLPDYWRRGVGRAMTYRLLSDAKGLGCSAAVLQASNMGRYLYEKMGFCQICEIEYYSWNNTTFERFMEA